MAQETIEAIRQAELAAEQTEKNVASEGDKIIAQAKAEAAETIMQLTKDAKEKAADALASAKKQSDSMMADALHLVEQELSTLRDAAKAKEPQAVQLILSELI